MIKLIIFDMDGVLIEAKQIHYDALNKALGEEYAIEWNEHLAKYDGLKTKEKLKLLTKERGLPESQHSYIWNTKQKYTCEMLKSVKFNSTLQYMMHQLKYNKLYNYKIAVCSNSIRNTVELIIDKLGVHQFVDLILSNEDVTHSKPHPQMYWDTMTQFGVLPEETIIFEDSPPGLLAANRSGAHVIRVASPKQLNWNFVYRRLIEIKMKGWIMPAPKWNDEKMNILIPMAGEGSRFALAGYTFPKPLIEIHGKPMIQVVVDNININAHYIFVVRKKHREQYNLDSLLNLIAPGCTIVETDTLTQGAACTALLAKKYIDNDAPLFFANSDQFVEWNSNDFMYKMQETKADGGIVTFEATHPKWSFAKVNELGLVTEVAEKNPISDTATVGYYYWKHGSDFAKYAEQMIERDIRVNNEFYVCPVFNQAIENNLEIRTYQADRMWGLGTPEDLEYYISNYNTEI